MKIFAINEYVAHVRRLGRLPVAGCMLDCMKYVGHSLGRSLLQVIYLVAGLAGRKGGQEAGEVAVSKGGQR